MKTFPTYLLLALLFLVGCTGLKTKRSSIVPIDVKISGTYSNTPYYNNIPLRDTMSLLEIFNIKEKEADEVHIEFKDEDHLILSFYESADSISQKVKTEIVFPGRFVKGNFFEIEFKNNKLVIPLIYGWRDIDRLRIGMLYGGDLVVDKKFADDSFVFIFGGGYGYRFQSYFRVME